MRHSIATVCLSGTLEQKLRAAAAAGFDGVELFEPDLLGSPLSPEEIRGLVDELGLTIDLYQPFRDFEAVDAPMFERNLRRAEAKFELMERLGADLLLVCSNVSDTAIAGDQLAARQLRILAERAAARGIRIAYEALAWGRHVNEYPHSWRIVEAADHPALGVCLDSFHILSRGTALDPIAEIPAEKLLFLQLADAPRLAMDVLQWSRHYRCFPGQGGFDLADFVARVLEAGYDGPLSLEVFNDIFRHADPERMAVDARRSMLVLEESLGSGRGRQLPRPAVLDGYAFVELAVEPASVAETQLTLHAFGFSPAAAHVTKPVTLWQQGDVRVLLNAAAAGPPGVAALAFESEDPRASANRAHELLAESRPRERGPGEADLSAVAAPDGTEVFFCRSDRLAEAEDWLGDFRPLAGAAEAGFAGPIRRIDHITLTQPFDYYDEAVLFYRSMLGLEPHELVELAAPTGLIRSRAMTNSTGTVKLALNVPVLGHDAPAQALQHVAFECADIFAAARMLSERGLRPLAIPDNYYEDLASRTDLDAATVAAMRDHGILYDRVGRGEFLQLYTPTLGGRLFFELVERRGRYDGYGAANAPIRMAVQRAGGAARREPVRAS